MADKLKSNRTGVDKLQKAEYILGVFNQMRPHLEAMGLRVGTSSFGTSVNITGKSGVDDKKVPMKDVKILMDEYLFRDDRLEVDSHPGGEWIFTTIKDKHTGGSYNFDVGMGQMECKKVEVRRTQRIVEDIEYKYDCE